MKFDNKKEIKIIPPIYIVLLAVFITNIFVNIELMAQDDPIQFSHFLPNIVTIFLLLFVYKIGVSFDFDSEGETLVLKNNGVFVSKFMDYRLKKVEFPKRKLTKFRLNDYGIYSTLHIYIQSRQKKGYRKYTFNTTFLSRNKKRALAESLKNILAKPKATA